MIDFARQPAITVESFLREVYVPSRIDMAAESIETMTCAVRMLDQWHGSPVLLSQLSEPFVRGFLSAYARDHSPATVNSRRGDILAIWQFAWEEDYLDSPPRRTRIRSARKRPAVPEAWTIEEVGRILTACRDCPGDIHGIPAPVYWRSILLTAYDTGQRRKSLLALEPSDVDLVRSCVVFRSTKAGQHRWAAITPETVDAIRQLPMDGERVWPGPAKPQSLNERLCTILRRAGVVHGRKHGGVFHKFRRTSGTLVEASGGDGARHLGNTRAVFERSYKDPRFFSSSVELLPRPF